MIDHDKPTTNPFSTVPKDQAPQKQKAPVFKKSGKKSRREKAAAAAAAEEAKEKAQRNTNSARFAALYLWTFRCISRSVPNFSANCRAILLAQNNMHRHPVALRVFWDTPRYFPLSGFKKAVVTCHIPFS